MLPFEILLVGDGAASDINNELEELVPDVFARGNHLNTGLAGWPQGVGGIAGMMSLEEGNHILLERLLEGDDAKVRVIARELRPNNRCRLDGFMLDSDPSNEDVIEGGARRTLWISSGVRGSNG